MKKFLLLLPLVAFGFAVKSQSLCFDPANDTRYETLSAASAVSVFDINEDGHLDVMSSGGEDALSIHLGNGDGTFDPFISGIQTTKEEIEFIDFDNDGDLDFYTYDNGDLVAATNNGNNTFSWLAYINLGQNGGANNEIAVADVTGDGIPDVLANDLVNNRILIAECAADGTFASQSEFTCIANPSHIKTGDLNGDGNADLVVAPATGTTIGVYISNNDGTFEETIVTAGELVQEGYNSLEITDMDGDDDLDVLVAGFSMYVMENNGSGTLTLLDEVFMGSYCYAFDTGDWDNDGDADVSWANLNGGGVTINLNVGDGTFPAQGNAFYSSNGNSVELAHGDFNEDGDVDIIVANGFERNFAFLEGHGNGQFGSLTLMAGYQSQGLAIGDFDNDGDQDIATTNSGTLETSFLVISLNNGDGSFADSEFYPNINSAGECVAAYLNNDDDIDLAIHTPYGYAIRLGNGDGTFEDWTLYDTNNPGEGGDRTITAFDANGDGIVDLAGSRPGADAVSVVLGNGDGSFDAPVIMEGAGYPRTLDGAHLNQDDFEDLIVCSNTTDEVWVYISNGDGTFQAPVAYPAVGYPEGLTFFDADEDSKLDMIVGSPNANKLYLFKGNGNGTFQPPLQTDLPTGSNSTRLAHGDVNGDGHEDVLSALYQTDAVGVLFGDGDGNFAPAIQYGVDQAPNRMETADFNNDGAIDFATLNSGIFNASVVLNNSAFISADGELAFCDGESLVLTSSEGYSYLWSTGETTQSITVTTPAEYWVEITNQSGDCTLITPSVQVEVFFGQEVTCDLDSTLVCVENGSFFLSGGFPFGGQYTGEGVVANVFDPAAVGEGVYTITYTYEDAGSCTSGSATDVITVDICGFVAENNLQVEVYPTITSDFINLKSNQPLVYSIMDMSGRLVNSGSHTRLQDTIDVSAFAAGVYVMAMTSGNETRVVRFEVK